jgi:hypothetical protein
MTSSSPTKKRPLKHAHKLVRTSHPMRRLPTPHAHATDVSWLTQSHCAPRSQLKKQVAEDVDAAAALTLLTTSPLSLEPAAPELSPVAPEAAAAAAELTSGLTLKLVEAAASPPVTPALEAAPTLVATGGRSRNVSGVPKNASASWNADQDEALKRLVSQHNARNWKQIAAGLEGKTPTQCLHRWQRVLNPNVVKGPWKSEEDGRLRQLVDEIGSKHWSRIATAMNGRNGKQCRERWINHLKPDISKEPWSKAEEGILIAAHEKMGSKWSEMEKLLKGRTENAIKNHWHSTLRKRKDASPPGPPAGSPAPSVATATGGEGVAAVEPVPKRQCVGADDGSKGSSPSTREVPRPPAAAPPASAAAPADPRVALAVEQFVASCAATAAAAAAAAAASSTANKLNGNSSVAVTSPGVSPVAEASSSSHRSGGGGSNDAAGGSQFPVAVPAKVWS